MHDTPGAPAADPRTHIDSAEVREYVAELARPRRTGSAGARETEARLRARFQELGYETRALRFSFSTLPGRYGLPAAGAVLLGTAVSTPSLLVSGRPLGALVTACIGLLVATLPLLFLPRALQLPWGRVETANLLFTRDDPQWIVMAHRDTKSQRAPTLVRTMALGLGGVAWMALTALAVAALIGTGAAPGPIWPAAGALVLAGVVLAVSPAGNASPGALDNATGLAAALALARRVGPDVAFLITDGEELGLAGARAAEPRLPDVAGIINLDGLDDPGPIRIAEGRRSRRREAVGAVAMTLLENARALGLAAVRRPLPPFVLVDHEPLVAAGRPALTLLKGSWRSLRRVHSPADTAGRIDGTGAAAVATLLLTTLDGRSGPGGGTLRADEPSRHSPPL